MKRIDLRLLAGSAVTVALLVPLAVFGGSAFARSTASGQPSSAQYQYRVTICHITGSKKHPAHTITVSSAAVAAHLRHGDHLGPCTGTETARAKHAKHAEHTNDNGDQNKNKTDDSSHGNDSPGHGNGNGNGHGHHK